MEFGKLHNKTDTTDFCLRQLVTDLWFMLRTCCALAIGNLLPGPALGMFELFG